MRSNFVSQVWGFIGAGYDTSSANFCWALKLLTDHPDVQGTLREALRKAYAPACAARRNPSVEEILNTSIPYLDATMEEVLRKESVGPFSVRMNLRDTTVLGRRIPKGTTVYMPKHGPGFLMPAYPIDDNKRSDEFRAATAEKGAIPSWNEEDMADFKPDRWLKPRRPAVALLKEVMAEGTDVEFDNLAGPTMPFSFGVRGCFGRRVALLQFRILLTMVIWNFELLPCPPELSGYEVVESLVRAPKKTFVRLKKIPLKA